MKRKAVIHTGTKGGTGLGQGHGGNTPDLPLIREVEDWNKGRLPGIEPGSRFFRMGTQISIILSRTDDYGWHMSIAHPKRYPTWDEIAKARYELIPDDCTMALMLPPRSQYVNIHNWCMQVHQVFDKAAPQEAFVMMDNRK